MKRGKQRSERSVQLNAGSLDLRSPAGKTTEGYFRLVVNMISDRQSRMRRIGGLKAFGGVTDGEPSLEKFAFISDQGSGDSNQQAVASMVTSWSPGYIVTGGDNIYGLPGGATQTQFDALFASTHTAMYASFLSSGMFFPTIGNHDVDGDESSPSFYRSKFPNLFQSGTKNYYSVRPNGGSVEFFILSSGFLTNGTVFEPDGNEIGSVQYLWFIQAVTLSTARFKVVVLHHPPFTSDVNYADGKSEMRWGFDSLGVDLVLCGHSHNYERWLTKGIPHIVCGTGGKDLRGYTKSDSDSESIIDNPPRFGALRVSVAGPRMTLEYVVVGGTVVDSVTISKQGNTDLHDQLITNAFFPRVAVNPPSFRVITPNILAGSPGTAVVNATPYDVTFSASTVDAYEPVVVSDIGGVTVVQSEPVVVATIS
jgi:hypothetical protein